MIDRLKKHYFLASILLICGFAVIRIIYASSFLLAPDETNYWQWSRHLAWGYHDQTPMIAWAIWFFTLLLGQTEMAVRMPSILSMTIASIYLVMIARHWFSDRVAWWTTLLSQSVFIFNIGSLLATADGLQGAAWAAAAYHVARGFENHQRRHWSMGGLWFGFGMLSKYTMVLFLPFVFLFGLISPIGRRRLVTFRPYAGCLLGIAMFSPVVLWNAANNWNSFRHVAYLGGANQQFVIHWKYFGEYIGSQIGLVTPMIFVLIGCGWIWSIKHWRHAEKWIYSFLFLTSLPMIAAFGLLSLHTRVYGNWPCAGYLTACVLAAAKRSEDGGHQEAKQKQTKSSRLWSWSLGSGYFLTALILVHVHWPILPIPPSKDRIIEELRGWGHLGNTVAEVRKTMPHPEESFIFGLRYQVASELAFYVPGQPYTVCINRWNRPNVYDYWWHDQALIGKDAVGVTHSKDSRTRLLEVFEDVGPAEPFPIYALKNNNEDQQAILPVRTLYIYRCYHFKGGLRWVPPRRDDIRASSLLDSSNH